MSRPFELDAALVGADESGDHVEHGCLAGTVRAEQADGLALAHVEAYAFHDHAADEALFDAVDREHALAVIRDGAIAFGSAPLPGNRTGRAFGCRGPSRLALKRLRDLPAWLTLEARRSAGRSSW